MTAYLCIAFKAQWVFPRQGKIGKFYFYSRKHIEVGLNLSLAAGPKMLCLCFWCFFQLARWFELPGQCRTTGRQIHTSSRVKTQRHKNICCFNINMYLFNLKFNPILCCLNIKTQVYTTPLPRCIYLCPDINGFAGKVGCQHVKTRVKTTDMCLSGWHVADMLANMSATRHKKLSTGVPGQHDTACYLLTCWQYVGIMTKILQ